MSLATDMFALCSGGQCFDTPLVSLSLLAQAADTAAIRAAITEEARRRGIEHTLKEERPPVARRSGLRLPADFLNASNEELMQLLHQALDGRMPPLPAGLQLTVGTGDAADEGAQEQEVRPCAPGPDQGLPAGVGTCLVGHPAAKPVR